MSANLKVTLTGNKSQLSAVLKSALGEANHFAKTVGSNLKGFITSPLTAIATSAAGFLTYETFKSGIEASIELGASLKALSERTGVAVEDLVMLQRTFKRNDVDASNLGATINKMQRKISDGSKSFEEIGLSVEALKSMGANEQFNTIARAIGSIPDPARRAAAAMNIFGRAGGELLPVFAHFDELDGNLTEKAKLLGAAADQFHAISVQFRAAADNLKTIFLGIAVQVTDELLYVAKMLNKPDFISIGRKIGAGLKEGVDFFIGVFKNPKPLLDVLKYEFLADLSAVKDALVAMFKYASELFAKVFNIATAVTVANFGIMITNEFNSISGAVSSIIMDWFKTPIALFMAAILTASDVAKDNAPKILDALIVGGTGYKASDKKDDLTPNERLVNNYTKIKDGLAFDQEQATKPIEQALLKFAYPAAEVLYDISNDLRKKADQARSDLMESGRNVITKSNEEDRVKKEFNAEINKPWQAVSNMSNGLTTGSKFRGLDAMMAGGSTSPLMTHNLLTNSLITGSGVGDVWGQIHSGDAARRKAAAAEEKKKADSVPGKMDKIIDLMEGD